MELSLTSADAAPTATASQAGSLVAQVKDLRGDTVSLLVGEVSGLNSVERHNDSKYTQWGRDIGPVALMGEGEGQSR